MAGSAGSKLTSVENNEAQTWLPGSAQSLQALNVATEHFGSADVSDAVIVCPQTGGLLVAQVNSAHGMGPVLAIGVEVTFLAMATLWPALLVICGRWVFWPFIPRYRPDAARPVAEHREWSAVAGLVAASRGSPGQ